MSIAEELVRVLPKEWGCHLRDGDGMIWFRSVINPCQCDINLSGEEESPGFINWALDELAKFVGVEMTGNTDGWQVRVHEVGDRENKYEVFIGDGPTKTLALAYALIAVSSEYLEQKNG